MLAFTRFTFRLAIRTLAVATSLWWALSVISFSIWLSLRQFGLSGCVHGEFGNFECGPALWYDQLINWTTGFWIVSLLLISDWTRNALNLPSLHDWRFPATILFWIGTFAMITLAIRFAVKMICGASRYIQAQR